MGKNLTEALDSVMRQIIDGVVSDDNSIPAPKLRGVFPASKSVGIDKPVAAPSTGGGIASPLTEDAYSTREFHAGVTESTTDGIFSRRADFVKKIHMTDANSAEVVLVFSKPA